MTEVLVGGIPQPFQVVPFDFWEFKGWEAIHANPAPGAQNKEVSFTFIQQDTVIAHLERTPFVYYLPNSFTPNNDGVNDIFRVEGNAIDATDFHLMIFNRWGEKVFETTDLTKPWDGSHQGGAYYVKDDVYMYRMKIKSIHDPQPVEVTGTVTVLR
ncbi:MAG: gliding motility-associated C-terminal domain-containing protein [Crocinitomicaceae bacterium]|nr:gliding motility-associated C-terminal domain-containing protein [Crocinitomicaceae bacterium]